AWTLLSATCRLRFRGKSLDGGRPMALRTGKNTSTNAGQENGEIQTQNLTRDQLIELLNGDLAREYQAIIAYVVYSQVLSGAKYMSIAEELENHASEELAHAIIIAKQIDYLGGTPTVVAKEVVPPSSAEKMLRSDLDNENETIRNYRERVAQCE